MSARKVKAAFVVYGRMNPPTKGHEMLIKRAAEMAKRENAPLMVYTTYTHNSDPNPRKTPFPGEEKNKNPLKPHEKARTIRRMFVKNNVVRSLPRDPNARRGLSKLNVRVSKATGARAVRTRAEAKRPSYPFRIIDDLRDKGYKKIVLVMGGDRVPRFSKMLEKEKGVEVRSAGERDPNSNSVNGISATKVRKAAICGNKNAFNRMTSNAIPMKTKERLMKLIRKRTSAPTRDRVQLENCKRPTPTRTRSLNRSLPKSLTDEIFKRSL